MAAEVRVNLDGLSDGKHEVNIVFYDIYGKMISSEGFGHEGTQLNRLIPFDGDLSMGMYMVQITVDGEPFATERLVVKKSISVLADSPPKPFLLSESIEEDSEGW